MAVALFCHVDPTREADRLRLRLDHLRYIGEHRHSIVAGGPTLAESGAPETMVILFDGDRAEAAEFLQDEPYTAHGVFVRVDVKPWARVLPEAHAGALDDAIVAEQQRRRPS